MLIVKEILTPEELEEAFKIRREVFVEEQNVPMEEEYDEFEESSKHYLALFDNNPAGTCRWRLTQEGVKMERFAVLKKYRSQKTGSALVEKTLEDIIKIYGDEKKIYLHAQLTAMKLYEKFGFKAEGEMFTECDIQHYKMVLEKIKP